MAVDLRCPNCSDNLGKDTENPKVAYCGNCGQDNIKNPRGYKEETLHYTCENETCRREYGGEYNGGFCSDECKG